MGVVARCHCGSQGQAVVATVHALHRCCMPNAVGVLHAAHTSSSETQYTLLTTNSIESYTITM